MAIFDALMVGESVEAGEGWEEAVLDEEETERDAAGRVVKGCAR